MAGMNLKVTVDDKNLDSLIAKLQQLKKEKDSLSSQLIGTNQVLDPKLFAALSTQLQRVTKDFDALATKISKYVSEQEAAKKATQDTSSGMGDMQKLLMKIGGTTAIIGLGKQIMDVRNQFQQLEIAFGTMLKSQEKAAILMKDLTKFAAETPFGLQSAASGAKQLLAYGSTSDTVIRELTMLGDVAAGTGQQIGDLVYLYGTLRTQGRAYLMDIRQFAGRGIPIYDELAKVLNTSKDKVNEFVSAGKVGFKEVEQAFKNMTAQGGLYGGLMEAQSKSIGGRLEALKDNIDSIFNQIGKDSEGFIYKSIDGINTLVENYETVGKVLLELVAIYGAYRAALIITVALQNVSNIRAYAAAFIETARSLGIATAAQTAFNTSIKANPYALAAAAVVALGYGVYKLATYQTQAEEAQNRLNNAFKESEKGVISETRELSVLKGELSAAKKGTEEYKKIKDQIVSKYGQYYAGLDGEIERVGLLDSTYKRLTDSIMKSFGARQYDKFIKDEFDNLDTVLNENLSKIQERIYDKFDDKEAAAKYFANIRNALIEGRELSKSSISVLDYIQDKGTLKADSRVDSYVKNIREAQKITEEIDIKARERFGIDDKDETTSSKEATKSIKSLSVQTEEARKKVTDLKKELADLQSGKVIKDSESIKQQLEYEQKLLDIEQDSFDKRYRQNQLNMAKELVSIEEFRQKMIKDQQEAAKSIYIKNNGNDKGFNFATFDKTLLPQGLSDSDIQTQIKRRTDASVAAWKKGNEDLAKEQKAFADQERLTFASELDQQIYTISSHYKERRDLAKGNTDLVKQINDNENKEIIAARLQSHQRQLEADADYNQKHQQLIEDRFVFESDKQKASLEQQIKDQKKIFNDLEKQVLNDPNNNELANQLRDAFIRLRLLNKELEKTPAQKLGEIASVFNQISSGLSDITGVDFSMIGNSLSGIASFASKDYLGAATAGFSIISGFVSGIISKKEQEAAIQREINKLQQQYNIDLRQQNYDLISSIDYARAFRDNLEALQWLVEKGFISNVDYSTWEALNSQAQEANKNILAAQQNYDKVKASAEVALNEAYRLRDKPVWKKYKDIAEDWKNGLISTEEAQRRLAATGVKGASEHADAIARAEEETQKWKDQIAELSQQMDEFATGTSFDSFLSDAANAIDDFRGDISSLADFTEEKLTNAILSSFKYQILSNALKPMYNELADMFLSGNYDSSAANDWKQRLTDLLQTNSNELDKIFEAFGVDPNTEGSSQKASSGYSVSMSQDTGDKLVGIATGSQMRLISIDEKVGHIAQWNQPVSEKFNFDTIAMPLGVLSQSSLRIERMIEENRNIAIQMFYLVRDIKGDTANLSGIKDGIDSMNNKLDNI